MYCKTCGAHIAEGSSLCSACRSPVSVGNNFCSNCGNQIYPGQLNCSRCGFPTNQSVYNQNATVQHSRLIAGLLAIFLGTLGIHNFYLGYTKKAITQVVLSTIVGVLTCFLSTIVVGLWAFIEAIYIFTGVIGVDGYGVRLRD